MLGGNVGGQESKQVDSVADPAGSPNLDTSTKIINQITYENKSFKSDPLKVVLDQLRVIDLAKTKVSQGKDFQNINNFA